jgi:hypothetical protein
MMGKALPDLIELSIIHKDGETVPIEITSAVTSYKGMFTNVVYVRDIIERKKNEEKINKLKEKYFHLFNSAPISIMASNIVF